MKDKKAHLSYRGGGVGRGEGGVWREGITGGRSRGALSGGVREPPTMHQPSDDKKKRINLAIKETYTCNKS